MNKKVKFNLLDFAIILLALTSVLAIVFSDEIRARFMFEEEEMEYTFTVNNVTEEMLNSFSENINMYFSEDSTRAGTISKFEYKREMSDIISEDGKRYTYENDLYSITGTATVSGKDKENGFYISGKYFAVPGKVFEVETGKLKFQITITAIKTK